MLPKYQQFCSMGYPDNKCILYHLILIPQGGSGYVMIHAYVMSLAPPAPECVMNCGKDEYVMNHPQLQNGPLRRQII